MWWKIGIIIAVILYLLAGLLVAYIAGAVGASFNQSAGMWTYIKIILFWPFILISFLV